MPEIKVIAEFDECPECGCVATVTREAIQPFKDSGKIPQDAEVASRTFRLPLLQPTSVSLTCPVMQLCWDHCLECGREYLVKAVVVEAPLTVKDMPRGNPFGQMPPGFPQG